jgi:hypothetical protein
VEVYLNGVMTASYDFAEDVEGGAGLLVQKGYSLVDDVAVWDETVLTP